MDYISATLGIEIKSRSWDGEGALPYYLIDRYGFTQVTLGGIPCLFMKPTGEPDTLSNIKKHMANVQKSTPLPIVLELESMVARRRKSLIESRIPFVSPQCHIYLPFMGIALQERYATVTAVAKTLMPSAQLLLFYYLYKDAAELYTNETAEIFNISPMQISRAIKQLTALGLVSTRKDGVRTVISSEECGAALFEKAKPYLLNPVRKRIYVERTELPANLPLTSYSALSELTMLGGAQAESFAFYGKRSAVTGTPTLVDNDTQAEVEIWHYNPTLLSENPATVDALSLAVSLSFDDNPRVEQSVNELLSSVWRKSHD